MRKIDYLRIAVTDRCNLRCTYCMPEEGIPLKSHEEILTLEEIEVLVRSLVPMGIKHIRLTGGEPLVRKNIVELVAKLRGIDGIEDITMTTNGIILAAMAEGLKAAGLTRVNVSMDTLRVDRFKEITRWGDLKDVLEGIDAALDAGLTPVKINVVAMKGFNDDEFVDFARFARDKGVSVRFIELMPIGESDAAVKEKHISIQKIKELIEAEMTLTRDENFKTNGPAEDYLIEGSEGHIGFIGALSNHFCSTCNRLRVTSEGRLRLCLHKDLEYDLKGMLWPGNEDKVREFVESVIPNKALEHSMNEEGWGKQKRKMSQIGG